MNTWHVAETDEGVLQEGWELGTDQERDRQGESTGLPG